MDWINFSNSVLGTEQFCSFTGGFGGDNEMWTAEPVIMREATFNASPSPDMVDGVNGCTSSM
jgi:hypothetical protein